MNIREWKEALSYRMSQIEEEFYRLREAQTKNGIVTDFDEFYEYLDSRTHTQLIEILVDNH